MDVRFYNRVMIRNDSLINFVFIAEFEDLGLSRNFCFAVYGALGVYFVLKGFFLTCILIIF